MPVGTEAFPGLLGERRDYRGGTGVQDQVWGRYAERSRPGRAGSVTSATSGVKASPISLMSSFN